MQLGNPPRNPGFHGAYGNLKNFSGFMVCIVFQIKERKGTAIRLIHLSQCGKHFCCIIPFRNHRGHLWQLAICFLQFLMGETNMSTLSIEKLTMQGGKQPTFHFRPVPQLVPLTGPKPKNLLGEITCIRLGPGQAKGKTIECGVVPLNR